MKLKKYQNKLLILSLLLMPTMVFAKSIGVSNIGFVLFEHAFCTPHMSLFVLKPLSQIFFEEKYKKTFWTLFFIRIAVLLYMDFILKVTAISFYLDFFSVFIGAFIIVPICAAITKTPIYTTTKNNAVKGIELRCAKCNSILKITDKVCSNCGEPFEGNNVVVTEKGKAVVVIPPKEAVKTSDFNELYTLKEDVMLTKIIENEILKAGINASSKLLPVDVLKRRKILNIIFSILVFIFISLIFFHFPIYTYILGLIILLIFYRVTRKFNLMKYLIKQIKSRPGEKFSNIIMYEKNNLLEDNSRSTFAFSILIAIALPLIIFSTPRIFYEEQAEGYAVRFYAFGLTNFKTATIPEYHNNKKVIALRGNTFSNMIYLEKVSLPDSITEIRGQAFKNCISLEEVNIPSNLEYLGGGAFYNATSIKRVELPDTLTTLGGESFYHATSLEYVKLSSNLTEIRGDSFEYCTSLRSIAIPDNVTRIGGHAFYGDTLLSSVEIGENSKLNEIGSSAFRQCSSLYSIKIPRTTSVNERAFKESPTIIEYFDDTYSNSTASEETSINYSYPCTTGDIKFNYSSESKTIYIDNEKVTYNLVANINDNETYYYLYGSIYNSSSSTKTMNMQIDLYDNNHYVIGKHLERIEVPKGSKSYSLKITEKDFNNNKILDDIYYYKVSFISFN